MSLPHYTPWQSLPPLAGIATFEEAMAPGLSVESCVENLKRHHWLLRRLHEVFLKRLPAEPVYELKMAFSLHAHYCAEHAAAWRRRVSEMREPPLGLETSPHPGLDIVAEELLCAPDTPALILGIYGVVVPALRESIESHQKKINRLVDHPTFRICRLALIEIREMESYGEAAVQAMVPGERRTKLSTWVDLLRKTLEAAWSSAADEESGSLPRHFSRPGRQPDYERRPRRDSRFPDPYNLGVHAEAFLYDDAMPPAPKTLMMYFKRLREIDVPEMMATIVADTTNQPWNYTVDMTRQLWDEARHAMMGEVGFVRAGIDWREFVRVNFTWSLALNTQLSPIERHAVLYFIEQGLMPKTGKRFEWEVGVASGDPFAALIQDYDWADEVLHARVGRDWYVRTRPSAKEAIEFGDRCWAKVLIDWEQYRAQGLTAHENWWPGLYREWCRLRELIPDPAVEAFSTTYAASRPDLKEISSSA